MIMQYHQYNINQGSSNQQKINVHTFRQTIMILIIHTTVHFGIWPYSYKYAILSNQQIPKY